MVKGHEEQGRVFGGKGLPGAMRDWRGISEGGFGERRPCEIEGCRVRKARVLWGWGM